MRFINFIEGCVDYYENYFSKKSTRDFFLSLERGVYGEFIKADIFDHPVAFLQNEVSAVDDIQEALSAFLNT